MAATRQRSRGNWLGLQRSARNVATWNASFHAVQHEPDTAVGRPCPWIRACRGPSWRDTSEFTWRRPCSAWHFRGAGRNSSAGRSLAARRERSQFRHQSLRRFRSRVDRTARRADGFQNFLAQQLRTASRKRPTPTDHRCSQIPIIPRVRQISPVTLRTNRRRVPTPNLRIRPDRKQLLRRILRETIHHPRTRPSIRLRR